MSDLAELTSRLAPAIAAAEAIIEAEVQRRVGAVEVRRNHRSHDRDAKIMAACQKVADATDRLQQARFAGGNEIAAKRRLLEAACNELCKCMRGRPK